MKLLIVVDMQNDFIDGALGTTEAQQIIPAVSKKVNEYNRDMNAEVIYTRDTHFTNYLDTQEGKKLPVPHCIQFTPGWEIHPKVYKFGCPVVDKKTFGYVDWANQFIKRQIVESLDEIESIELVGVCTDICVISNAMILKAIFTEIPIIVDSSCCAGVSPESHSRALEAMKMCQIEVR